MWLTLCTLALVNSAGMHMCILTSHRYLRSTDLLAVFPHAFPYLANALLHPHIIGLGFPK